MPMPTWVAHVRVDDPADTLPVEAFLGSKTPVDVALRNGAVIVDAELGFAISARDPAGDDWPRGVAVLAAARDDPFRLAQHRAVPPAMRWRKSARMPHPQGTMRVAAGTRSGVSYLAERLGGWPRQLTGAGVVVAVLDSGIGDGLAQLPRRGNGSDFNSAESPGAPTHDMSNDSHGTCCAGIIGARSAGTRTSAAPDCEILAGQITSKAGTYTTVANILLMLRWARDTGARIVNMSFNAEEERVLDPQLAVVLGNTVTAMRRDNDVLVFATAEEGWSGLCFPACAPGVVAVGLCQTIRDRNHQRKKVDVYRIGSPQPWIDKKPDLLFGPGDQASTIDKAGNAVTFGDLSAGCAFVSGVAAQYIHKYPGDGADRILARMTDDADGIRDVDWKLRWPCVRFPK